ncbi:MAG: trypsin-like peptidase domain-containing protein [Candidatus Staskawiczbacteria bacterium]|nr:trypsin-like peptidase domain-containing protein [Candidatus Staskawiczbacteria bacterium]
MKEKIVVQIIAIIVLGAAGAFVFQALIFPWMLSDQYFERFEFIKSFKEGKIVINPKEQIYIQENIALVSSIEKIEKSVAGILVEKGKTVVSGTGFVITSDGLIITIADLVPIGAKITVFLQGEQFSPAILKRDSANNLVLLKIEKTGLATVGFFDFEKIKLGQRVFLAGKNPKTLGTSVNEGIIKYFNNDIIATNITDSSYFKGGPLFNIEGRLVGINTVDSGGEVFSISVKKVKTFAGF